MAAIPAWRASLSVRPVWCAMCVTSPTKPRSFRLRRKDLRPPHAQGVEASGVGFVVFSGWQSLDMLHFGRRAGEEKEGAAGLGVIAPHLGGAVLAGEGGRTRQGAQLAGLKAGEDIRL